MKIKVFLLAICIVFGFNNINTFAEIEAMSNLEKGIVVVKGNPGVEFAGSDVIIMALDNVLSLEEAKTEDVRHIGSCNVDGYGNFRYKFSVATEQPQNLRLYVKQGTKNLTDTVVSAEFSSFIKLDTYYDDKNKTLTLNAENVYWGEEGVFAGAAAYDENNRLVSFKKIDMDLSYLDINKQYTIPFDIGDGNIIKVYLWENIDLMKPVSQPVTKRIVKSEIIDEIDVPYGTILSIYSEDEIKETAVKLFSNLDPESEDTKDIYKLYSDGYYPESLVLFRKYMIDRIRAIDYTDSIDNRGWYKSNGGNGQHTDAMKVLCGKMSASEYNAKYKTAQNSASYFQKDYGGYFKTFDTKIDTNINWLEIPTWISNTVKAPSDARSYSADQLYPMACLYACTGDLTYLERYIQILNDYSCNYVDMVNSLVDGMSDEDAQYYQKYTDSRVWKYKLGGYNAPARLETAGTAQRLMAGLITLCKALPSENIENQYTDEFYMDMNNAVYTDELSDTAYDLIDPVRFANICHQISVNEFFRLSSYLDGGAIPNQLTNGLTGLMKYLCLFKDFDCCNDYEVEVIAAYNDCLNKTNQPDGGYLEISEGYNEGDYELKKNIVSWIESICPEYADEFDLSKSNLYFGRLREMLTSPVNLMSNYGNGYSGGTAPYWKNAALANKLDNERTHLLDNEYTSVYLPYSGYGSMRESWTSDSMYMSFFNYNKRNSGHYMAGTNAILNLTAYKRTLLLSGGTHDYNGVEKLNDNATELKTKFYELNSYLGEGSTRKWSTVMVNDKSQAEKMYEFNEDGSFSTSNNYGTTLSEVDNEVLDNRWLSSDKFDFAEGTWDGGYSLVDRDESLQTVKYKPYTDTGAIKKDAVHNRQMIFVKDAGIWVVTDTLENIIGGSNKYSQIWNFPGYDENKQNTYSGFTNEQVVIDDTNNMVYTNDTTGPNLFIKSFSPKNLSFNKYYGYHKKGEVGLGWFRGGSDIAMDGFAPKADVHINWYDGASGDKTQLISVLAPSENTNNPIIEHEDLSEGNISGFKIKLSNGCEVYYKSSPDVGLLELEGITTYAKSVLVVKTSLGYNGIVLDAENISYDGVSAGCDGSFEFDITDGSLEYKNAIEIPDGFEWINTENGYYPVY